MDKPEYSVLGFCFAVVMVFIFFIGYLIGENETQKDIGKRLNILINNDSEITQEDLQFVLNDYGYKFVKNEQ